MAWTVVTLGGGLGYSDGNGYGWGFWVWALFSVVIWTLQV